MPTTPHVTTPDGDMALYDAEPEGSPRGAVIVAQEGFGVTSYLEDVTRRLAAAGYRAVAPHFFHRSGDPDLQYGDLSPLRPHLDSLTRQGIDDDLDATVAYLNNLGFQGKRIAMVGFCMGGSIAFYASVRYAFGASVTFYGSGIVGGRLFPAQLDSVSSLQTPWLGLYGDLDKGIPIEDVEALRKATSSSAPVPTEIVRYADADHGFHCDPRPVYNDVAAKDAWRRTLEWFETHIG